ncbi:MAG: proprotein convertase P-domain-containing protein [Bacteroidetes bacterium]|nr:proprotein convertase P-domain-containing protein [Bacteroidota bacterium]
MKNKYTQSFLFSLSLLLAFSNICFSQLMWNQAGKFNGSGSYTYLAIPNSTDLNKIEECMYEMWVNMASYPSGGTYYQFLNKNQDYQLAYDGSLSKVYVRNNSGNGNDLFGPNLSLNRWYHLAVIIRDTHIVGLSDSKVRELYVDGLIYSKDVQQYADSTLGTSTDSLKIGSYGAPNFLGTFNGNLDDVRLWLGKFYPADVASNYRSTLSGWGSTNNYYYKCILSITFQDVDNSGSPFFISDRSRIGRTVKNNNVTAYDMSLRPSVTTFPNQSIHLNGTTDYLAAADHSSLSPSSFVTLEAWVYPEKTYTGAFSDAGTILCKGLSSANYRLYLGGGNEVFASINGNLSFPSSSSAIAPVNQWTHVAFTYDGTNGNYNYYVNGVAAGSGTNNQGNITNSVDSFYVGQFNGSFSFKGYIDELRVAGYIKTQQQIYDFIYKAMDTGDRPSAFDLVCYNFDGYLENNNGLSPRLYFRNGADFSSHYIPSTKNFPISPLLKADNFSFPTAWYISSTNFRIPASGTSGSSQYDTINIPYCKGVLDINVFLALNHSYEKDLTAWLISPAGDSLELVKGNSMERGQFITIFNDQADSSIINDRYTSFLPNIKPFTSISSVMSGVNTRGDWKLRVSDALNGDTGMVYAWGLQFNNMVAKPNLMTLTSTANQNGFWNGSSQPLDTVRMYLRNTSAPYTKVDSAIGYINQFGFCTTYLANALNGSYYIEYRHRNSLAVWSSLPKSFSQGGSTSFSILSGPSTVYGGELISVNGRWCMYSGDINQDDVVNGNDFTIFSQQFGQSGYLASDLNGDGAVNGNDFTVFSTGFGRQTLHP